MSESMTTAELRDLYRELILDHARSPRHFGRLDNATHSARGLNPLCGDKLQLFLNVNDDRSISDASFEGTGCAISVASASLLTDQIIGMPVEDAHALFAAVTAALTGNADATDERDLGKLRALEGVKEFPSRVKCATLAWHAMESALNDESQPATTE